MKQNEVKPIALAGEKKSKISKKRAAEIKEFEEMKAAYFALFSGLTPINKNEDDNGTKRS